MDRNTLHYIIILFGSFITCYSVFTMTATTDINGTTRMNISSVVFIAPILVINSLFYILYEEKIDMFRRTDKRLMFAIFTQKIFDKIDEGKRLHKEFKNR